MSQNMHDPYDLIREYRQLRKVHKLKAKEDLKQQFQSSFEMAEFLENEAFLQARQKFVQRTAKILAKGLNESFDHTNNIERTKRSIKRSIKQRLKDIKRIKSISFEDMNNLKDQLTLDLQCLKERKKIYYALYWHSNKNQREG